MTSVSLPLIAAQSIGVDNGRGYLIAQDCTECGRLYFPRGHSCPDCGSMKLDDRRLSEEGVIWSLTFVRRAPTGFEPGYCLAWVDFPEGVRVIGQVGGDSLEIGTPVTVKVGVPPAGAPNPSYYFQVSESAQALRATDDVASKPL